MIFVNFLTFIPLIILLLIAAIMSSIGAANLKKLKDQSKKVKNAYGWVTGSTIFLWISFVISLGAVLIIPTIASFPYLYGIVMFIFILFDLALAGIFFYGANAARTSQDYKDGDSNAKRAFNSLLAIGIIMMIVALLLGIYTFWGIRKYRKQGGLTGDIALGAKVAPYVLGPEFAPVAEVAGQYATQQLSPEQQQELQQRQQGFEQLYTTGQQIGSTQQKQGGGLQGLYQTMKQNPQLFQKVQQSLT